jgi:putative SOS response-associated peptidase YedK
MSLFMAGLYQTEEGSELPRFVMLTRPAALELAFIHDRMPVIIPNTAQSAWLEGKIGIMDLNAVEKMQLEYEAV